MFLSICNTSKNAKLEHYLDLCPVEANINASSDIQDVMQRGKMNDWKRAL